MGNHTAESAVPAWHDSTSDEPMVDHHILDNVWLKVEQSQASGSGWFSRFNIDFIGNQTAVETWNLATIPAPCIQIVSLGQCQCV